MFKIILNTLLKLVYVNEKTKHSVKKSTSKNNFI